MYKYKIRNRLLFLPTRATLTRYVRCAKNKGGRILGATKNLRRLYKSKPLQIIYNSKIIIRHRRLEPNNMIHIFGICFRK